MGKINMIEELKKLLDFTVSWKTGSHHWLAGKLTEVSNRGESNRKHMFTMSILTIFSK